MSNLTQIQEALAVMSSNSQDKQQALHFLEDFQKTPEAWNAVHTILSDQSSPLELRMFAAQTLRSKTTYDLHQIPQEQLAPLKDSIINFLIQYSTTSKLIRTQLCVSLSKFAIQYTTWPNALDEIMSKLQNNVPTLLEFLKVLPEESLDAKSTPLTDHEFRERINDLIVANVEKVLTLLSNFTQSSGNDSQAHALILDCLNSWIREIPVESLLQIEPLTNIIFKSLQDEESFDKAVECLCTIVNETQDIDNAQLIEALYQQIAQLRPLLKQYKDDPDVFGALTRLFVEAGEAWHVLIAKEPKKYLPLVEMLLECAAYDEDLEIVKYTFYFWYILKQMILPDRFAEAKEVLRPIYCQLINVMIRHLHYPNGSETDPLFSNKEEEEKFKDFRYDMGDVLKDCTAVVGAPVALSIPFEQIKTALQSPNAKWQDVEAPLFSLRAMAKEVSLKEDTIMPQIMELLVQLPENVKIRYAATLVLGRYTEWTSKHPEFLEKQLNYIINGFQASDPDIINAASHALMYFCHDCAKLLADYIEQLYSFYINILGSSIDKESLYEITDGIAHIIDKQDPNNIANATMMFIKPVMERLSKYAEAEGSEEVYTAIADEVEIVRYYFDVLRPRQFQAAEDPVANIAKEVYPLIATLIEKHGHSLKVSERCMKFTKTVIQTYALYLTDLLPTIVNLLVKGFQQTQFGCYLYVSGSVIREFGDEDTPDATRQAVWAFTYQQISTFLEVFKNTKPIEIPDLIEDFFRMMGDVLSFQIVSFVSSDILKSSFEIAVMSLDIEKFEPLVTTLHFLIDLVSWGFDSPPVSILNEIPPEVKQIVRTFVASNGGLLINALLQGLVFKFPSEAVLDASDLLGKTLRLAPSPEVSVQWLNAALDSFPAHTVSDQERNKLVQTVGNALASKDYRRIRMSVKDFVEWYSRKNVTPRFHN
ncbi:CYFA0S10e04346g1_1 [Cyberlindnera fabianii]|uniref:CYFA0S10e04346g1_1 n=1 Tax=Cyberlindnera fabianii TaxID=36022 RepID=A0A061B7U4_CYBFA|nr:CYFA0S10e04346g1_1 [Cyberlindnera fabianii]